MMTNNKHNTGSIIKAAGLSLRYRDGTTALKDIDLDIREGMLVFLTGPSGSGKTSLLKLLLGMETPTAGTLTVLGRNASGHGSGSLMKIRRKIGPVFQDFRLINGRTALENVVIGMRFLGFKSKEMKERALEALDRTGLAGKAASAVEHLSWGERQRVAIARAAARKPILILADEPTGNLDRENAVRILELLASYRDNDTAVLITTHATHLTSGIEDAVFLKLDQGRLLSGERGEMP